MTSTAAIFIYLIVIKTVYAYVLSRRPLRWLEPDYTWMLVLLGVAICIVAAAVDRRLNGPLSADVYEVRIWLALLWRGVPIAVWQIGKSARAWARIFRRIFEGTPHGNQTEGAAGMAEECGELSQADD